MKKILIFTKIFIFLFISFIIVNLSFYVYAYFTPKFNINSNKDILMYDKNGENFFSDQNFNDYTKLEDISPHVINGIISVEDKNFYSHKGFDFFRILKAIFINLKNKEIKQGASTISQQYVKNLFLDFNQTWERKIEEAFLTFELEVHYTKDEILEGYLNTIDFGAGNYGITSASKYYFNKLPSELNIEEATILVGIPKSPKNYNPITNLENAKKRQLIVLSSMEKNNIISKDEIDKIHSKDINLYGKNDKNALSSIYYYKDAVINELKNLDNIPSSLLESNGLKIFTNLDKNAQKKLEENIDIEMKESNMQVASTIIEPNSGSIIALIGGKDYNKSQYNRVISSKRQVGSTIKPILYYSALENGFTPSTTFLSEKTSFNLGDEVYSPKNAGNIYANKDISLLSAIAYSDNIYALKTHLFLGQELLGNTAKRMKISAEIASNASSALGTTEINMIDFSNAYISLANEGIYNKPHIINKITDINDTVIYEYEENQEHLLNEKYLYILNQLLSNTYDYSLVKYTSPTLISIRNEIDKKFAVKSGSTNTDYWTIGYNKNYLVMVWNGYDDNSKVNSSESKISKKIWAKTINDLPNQENSWYDIPDGIVATKIDSISGEYNDEGHICYYEKGTEPNYIFDDYFNIKEKD